MYERTANNFIQKYEYMIKNKKWMFIMFVLTILCLWEVYDTERQETSGVPVVTSMLGEMTKGHVYAQEIYVENKYIKSIQFYFSTYGRINNSKLKVNIYCKHISDNHLIQTCEIDCRKLADNSWCTLILDNKPCDDCCSLYITLESSAIENTGITIGINNNQTYSGLYIDGSAQIGSAICYVVTYSLSNNILLFFIHIVLAGAFLVLNIINKKGFKLEIVFLISWVLLSVLYIFSNTLFNVPDEPAHFCRAYEVSIRHFVSSMSEDGTAVGRNLPLDIDFDLLKNSWQSFWDNRKMTLSGRWVFKSFFPTAVYAPISYMPQAAGIFLARQFTSNIAVIVYIGRLFNWMCITFLLYMSVRIIPWGKQIIALLALLPMNLQESVSLAPDGMVVAISVFMISYVLWLRFKYNKTLTCRYIVILYVLALMVSLYKIVYVPFCLIYLLIPIEKFGNIKRWLLHAVIIGLAVSASSLFWLEIAKEFPTRPGTNPVLQMEYVIRYPGRFFLAIIRTDMNNILEWILQMGGHNLAWLNVPTIPALCAGYFGVLCMYMRYKSYAIDKLDIICGMRGII